MWLHFKPAVPWPQKPWSLQDLLKPSSLHTVLSTDPQLHKSHLWLRNHDIFSCMRPFTVETIQTSSSINCWRQEWQITLTHRHTTLSHHISCCHHLTHHQRLFMDTSITVVKCFLSVLSVCCCTTSYSTDSQVAPFTSSEKKREGDKWACVRQRERKHFRFGLLKPF